jgi:prephenate dehydrogenase
VRVAVLGLGLIGGSLAAALPDPFDVVGFDVDVTTRAAAEGDGIIVADSVASAVSRADIVVVAVPVDAIADTFAAIAPAVRPDAIVTDTASVKGPVVVAARAAGLRFVGGHPMAGRETSGYESATGSLFGGARWALCLEADTCVDDLLQIATVVHAVGAGAVPVGAAAHDRAVAVVSHLPHVTAAALAARAIDDVEGDLLLGLAGGSFRDATRVARAPAAFWSAVLRANAPTMAVLLREHAATLQQIAALAERGDADALERFFAHGGESRIRFEARTGAPIAITLPADEDEAREVLLDLGRRGGYITSVEAGRVLHARVSGSTSA